MQTKQMAKHFLKISFPQVESQQDNLEHAISGIGLDVNCRLIKQCRHFINDSTRAHASVSIALYRRSDLERALELTTTRCSYCLKDITLHRVHSVLF